MRQHVNAGWFALCAVVGLAALGCGSAKPNASKPSTVSESHTRMGQIRTSDHASNDVVSVDEAGLHGVVRDGSLELSIPVHASRAGQGSLRATLIAVDASSTAAEGVASYALAAGADSTLSASLKLPTDLKQQADRARYSVRVEDVGESVLRVTRSLLYVLSPYEVRLEGPAKVHTGKQASYRVRAQDPLSHQPVPATSVGLVLTQDGKEVRSLSAQTDETGSAVFELDVAEAGAYSVSARAEDQGSPLELSTMVNAEAPGQKLLVTTDKPVYQPGQTIHLRVLSLQDPGNTPLRDAQLVLEVEDGKGNKVFKKAQQTDAYGIAAADFRLATLVNMGTFKVRAVAGEQKAEKTVEVSRYVLPKFALELTADKPWYTPGSAVAGSVNARYFFGKNVDSADVVVEGLTLDVGSNVFQRVMGKTDADGHFAFTLQLPATLAGIPLQDGNALFTLRATLTDTAGQQVSKEIALSVAAQGVRLSLVPEATQLVPGVENRVHLFATDPIGAPIANAEVALSGGAPTMTARTDNFGHVELRFKPESATAAIDVKLTTADGQSVAQSFNLASQSGAEHVLVRTDKAVYAIGESVKVEVLASNAEQHVYVDWLNAGQSVDMRTLPVDQGLASFDLTLDAGLIGENRIEAYVVDDDGNVVRAGRTIVVNRDAALHVAMAQDKPQYKPGEPATLTLSVTNDRGEPTMAALGVQIVDEAVFGLVDAQPGLLRTFFELEDEFAKPQYEIQVPPVNFEKLVFEDVAAAQNDQRKAAQVQAEAQLSALAGNHMLGVALASWPDTLVKAQTALAPFLDVERTRLAKALTPLFTSAADALAASGCTRSSYYCTAMQKSYGDALVELALRTAQPIDFWGNAYVLPTTSALPQLQLGSRGPDEKSGTADDVSLGIDWSALGAAAALSSGPGGVAFGAQPGMFANPQAGGGPQRAAGTGGAAAIPLTTADAGVANPNGAADAQSPRVRKNFPETLYVNPALITDPTGKASVSLDMADSITSWRVSALANSAAGELGGGQAGVTVFQDFFVDVSFPAQLTRGDQVEFPIVVYNYLTTTQTVRLELAQASWFTALGSANQSLDLAPGEVRSVRIPVQVEQVGTQTLTVRAFGSSVSDAVARSVLVIPDGMKMPQAHSGSLASGNVALSASFPANAVSGSGLLYLDVYPAFVSQAVQGLDSMLQVPSGCFEQTTSTTWPNVLVTRYMEQTHQTTPEIALKAESLISAGYQRLLTFEHASGGFSWFGDHDPNADISVTAFGLMEFADMANVQAVDPLLIQRTQSWLTAQQAADGSFMGGTTEFFTFQTSSTRNTAFVVWALAASGYSGPVLAKGLDYVRGHIGPDDDAYTVALAANAFAAAAPADPETQTLIDQLEAKKQQQNGKTFWDSGATQTNFYAAGADAAVSTTALVAHAMLSTSSNPSTVKSALDYITSAKDTAGNFGSTQASVWALKTLLLAALHGTEGAIGTLDVSVDGQAFMSVPLLKEQWDVSTRVDMSQLATTGDHTLALSFAGSGEVSYNLVSSYHVPWAQAPEPPADGPLSVAIHYDRTTLVVDESVTASVDISNLTDATQNMLLVSVGIAPGFEVQTEDLESYVTKGELSRFELTGKQLMLYLSTLSPKGTQTFNYKLRATMPVRAADGGGQVFLYYQPTQKAQSASTLLVATAS